MKIFPPRTPSAARNTLPLGDRDRRLEKRVAKALGGQIVPSPERQAPPVTAHTFEPTNPNELKNHLVCLKPGQRMQLDRTQPLVTGREMLRTSDVDAGAILVTAFISGSQAPGSEPAIMRQRRELLRRVHVLDTSQRIYGHTDAERGRPLPIRLAGANQLVQAQTDLQVDKASEGTDRRMPTVYPGRPQVIGTAPNAWLPLAPQTPTEFVPAGLYEDTSPHLLVSVGDEQEVFVDNYGDSDVWVLRGRPKELSGVQERDNVDVADPWAELDTGVQDADVEYREKSWLNEQALSGNTMQLPRVVSRRRGDGDATAMLPSPYRIPQDPYAGLTSSHKTFQ